MWRQVLLAAVVVSGAALSAQAQSRGEDRSSRSRDDRNASVRDDMNAWSRRSDAQSGMFRQDGSSSVKLPPASSVRERIDQIRQVNANQRSAEDASRASGRGSDASRTGQTDRRRDAVSASPYAATPFKSSAMDASTGRHAPQPVATEVRADNHSSSDARSSGGQRSDRSSSYNDRSDRDGDRSANSRHNSNKHDRESDHSSSSVSVAGSFSYSSGYRDSVYVAPAAVYNDRFTTASAWTAYNGGGATYVREPTYAGGLRQVYYPNRYGPFYEPVCAPVVYAPAYCSPVTYYRPAYYCAPVARPCWPGYSSYGYYGRGYYPAQSGFSVSVWGRF